MAPAEPNTQVGIPGVPQGNVTPPRSVEPDSESKTKTTPLQPRLNKYSLKPSIPSPEKRIDVANHTQGYYYGPMPVQEFFDTFMPYKDLSFKRNRPSETQREKLISVATMESESAMYTAFVDALKGWPPPDDGRRKVELEFHDVHSYQDPNCGELAVDVAVVDTSIKHLWANGKKVSFSEHETHTEFKLSNSFDPFVEKETNRQIEDSTQDSADDNTNILSTRDWGDFEFENSTNDGISCRGQLAYYAAAAMTVQYRTHFFQLLMFNAYARIIRWDRSCAIVSQRFDYAEEPDLIFDFYRRLAQLDRGERGYDPEITYATEGEAELARAAFRSFHPDGWHGRFEFPKKLHNRDIRSQAFRTLTTGDSQFVICAPVFYPDCYTPFGRSTQRSLAYRLGKETICFMKHFHSQNYSTTLKESTVYLRLDDKRKTDKNFPRGFCRMITGGDVPGTVSIGHLFWNASWVCGCVREPRQLIVHRIFLEEVGRSIRTFTNAKTMLTCVADAMEAHSYLLHVLGILHRDISPGNILMERYPEVPGGKVRRGMLIDFDHALDLNRTGRSQSPGRSGTFQFFSAALLLDPRVVQSGIDDRESCFHSIVYLSMLHLQHGLSNNPTKLHAQLMSLFEDALGTHKEGALTQNLYQRFDWANQGLQKTLTVLADVIKWRYVEIAEESPELAVILKKLRDENMKLLEDRHWMHNTIREHLKTMPDPPEEIEFVVNSHHPLVTTPASKRSSDTLNTSNRLGLDGHLPADISSSNKRQKTK
ncbi:hypothetical protein E1B28_003863 [Marasmius oreades]|uniref:Fungal-type protein kinase domain-containing protein n=1 Tax=Marasmius oreades TaxID=181124 RepID=A0A9P7UXE1_9AGAR|nr:uncharacterized protein E1B28_003863 [Marasmius oreades]KAG7096426.1 hypothetical protein E1B28_003863 [Marasmius oreades]